MICGNSRINVPISLGIKLSIHFSEFLLNFSINNFTNYKLIDDGFPIITYEHFNQITLLCLNEYKHLLHNALCYNKLLYFNTKYAYNNVLITYEGELAVYLLKKIICLNENTVFIFCQKRDIICYVNHLTSFKINKIIKNEYELKT